MSSSVFQNANTHVIEIFCFNISESQTYSKYHLPLSRKYSNFVSMLYTSYRQCSNVQAYVMDNTQSFTCCIKFSIIYLKKYLAALIYFIISLFYLFKLNTAASKQHSAARCFQVIVLLSTDKIKSKVAVNSMARLDLQTLGRSYQILVGISRTTSS